MAMNHNIGAGGMLMVLGSDLAVGETVTVTFRLPPGQVEYQVHGTVLRIEPNTEDPEGSWPMRVAVQFEQVDAALEPLIAAASERFSS
jgi:hypothetical protein